MTKEDTGNDAKIHTVCVHPISAAAKGRWRGLRRVERITDTSALVLSLISGVSWTAVGGAEAHNMFVMKAGVGSC